MFSAASWSVTTNHVTPPAITMMTPMTATMVPKTRGLRVAFAMTAPIQEGRPGLTGRSCSQADPREPGTDHPSRVRRWPHVQRIGMQRELDVTPSRTVVVLFAPPAEEGT